MSTSTKTTTDKEKEEEIQAPKSKVEEWAEKDYLSKYIDEADASYNERAAELDAEADTQKNEVHTQIDAQITAAEDDVRSKTLELDRDYNDIVDSAAVQREIDRRQVAETMANMGLTSSGLSATQQTAVQLSAGNKIAAANLSRQQAVDSLTKSLAEYRMQSENTRRESINQIDANLSAAKTDYKNTVYQTAYDRANTERQQAFEEAQAVDEYNAGIAEINANYKLQSEAAAREAEQQQAEAEREEAERVRQWNADQAQRYLEQGSITQADCAAVEAGAKTIADLANAGAIKEAGTYISVTDWRENNKEALEVLYKSGCIGPQIYAQALNADYPVDQLVQEGYVKAAGTYTQKQENSNDSGGGAQSTVSSDDKAAAKALYDAGQIDSIQYAKVINGSVSVDDVIKSVENGAIASDEPNTAYQWSWQTASYRKVSDGGIGSWFDGIDGGDTVEYYDENGAIKTITLDELYKKLKNEGMDTASAKKFLKQFNDYVSRSEWHAADGSAFETLRKEAQSLIGSTSVVEKENFIVRISDMETTGAISTQQAIQLESIAGITEEERRAFYKKYSGVS